MGIRYSANIVIGFKIEKKPIKIKVTKYHEDTGEPYQADIVQDYGHYLNGKLIPESVQNPDFFCVGEEFMSLEIFEDGYEEGQRYIGFSMGSVEDGKNSEEIDINLTEDENLDTLSELYSTRPRVYLILSCG